MHLPKPPKEYRRQIASTQKDRPMATTDRRLILFLPEMKLRKLPLKGPLLAHNVGSAQRRTSLTASNGATRNFEQIISNCDADKATVIWWNMRYVMIINLYRN